MKRFNFRSMFLLGAALLAACGGTDAELLELGAAGHGLAVAPASILGEDVAGCDSLAAAPASGSAANWTMLRHPADQALVVLLRGGCAVCIGTLLEVTDGLRRIGLPQLANKTTMLIGGPAPEGPSGRPGDPPADDPVPIEPGDPPRAGAGAPSSGGQPRVDSKGHLEDDPVPIRGRVVVLNTTAQSSTK